MYKLTARSASILCQPGDRRPANGPRVGGVSLPTAEGTILLCFPLASGVAACTSDSSSPDAAVARGRQSGSSSTQTGGSSGTGGASPNGGSSSLGG